MTVRLYVVSYYDDYFCKWIIYSFSLNKELAEKEAKTLCFKETSVDEYEVSDTEICNRYDYVLDD